jgi:predicted methyltransferase MtxX (methanogen marker protein 4)
MALRSTDEKGETVWRGSATLAGLWREIDDRQMDVALDAIVATLIEAVQRGTVSSTPVVLSLMEDRALPAVPHLIWASDNSPSYLIPKGVPPALPGRQ